MSDCCKILMSWNDLGYPRSEYMNNPRWSTTTMLFMQYILFRPLNQLQWAGLFQGLTNFGESTINKSNSALELWKLCSQDLTFFNNGPPNFIGNSGIDARIDAFLFQFHKNSWYLVTLLCFIYNMKLSKCCFGVNLDGCLEMWCGSLVDFAWLMMVGPHVVPTPQTQSN
jgi:hypothetical protein